MPEDTSDRVGGPEWVAIERATVIERATITIEVDATGGVSFTVLGEPGRAKNIAEFVMRKVIKTQRLGNYLGTKEYQHQ